MKPVIVPKLWGHEEHIVNSHLYCGKILVVQPQGIACSLHMHLKKTESFYILQGKLYLEMKDVQILTVGDSITIYPGEYHRFWARSEPCRFIEFSTTDHPSDTYRLEESGPIPKGK